MPIFTPATNKGGMSVTKPVVTSGPTKSAPVSVAKPTFTPATTKGGMSSGTPVFTKKFAKGGSASKRADGIAERGKTKGTNVVMCGGGMAYGKK